MATARRSSLRVRMESMDPAVNQGFAQRLIEALEPACQRRGGPVPLPSREKRFKLSHEEATAYRDARVNVLFVDFIGLSPEGAQALAQMEAPAQVKVEVTDLTQAETERESRRQEHAKQTARKQRQLKKRK